MIGLLMLVAATIAPTQADFACLRATGWGMANERDAQMRYPFTVANAYFLGRLAARDDKSDWVGRVTDAARSSPYTERQYLDLLGRCLIIYAAKLPAPDKR